MKRLSKNKIIFILFASFLLLLIIKLFSRSKFGNEDTLSIIIYMTTFSVEKHLLFYQIIKEFDASRVFYFIKSNGKELNESISKIVNNDMIKIVQSNFPDSLYLPLALSLYGNNIPLLVLFINGDDLLDSIGFKKWYLRAFKFINFFGYDYIFGDYQIIGDKKIGCSLLLTKSSIIQHLLYYTDSDTTHINPFIQLSLSNKTKFGFLSFEYIKASHLENINQKFSINLNCPKIGVKNNNSLCIMLPAFRRNYFSESFLSFSNQTYNPKFYVFIQNDNRRQFNLKFLKNLVNVPVYHIWMQNWNSYFFLPHRLSSLFPCDFIIKYDDDQWPIDDSLHEKLISESNYKNIILCGRGYFVERTFKAYPVENYYKNNESIVVDHCATPLLIKPSFLKLDARNKIYSIHHAEDVALSVNSMNLCNIPSIYINMNIIQKHFDGSNEESDFKNSLIYKKDKNIFENSYQYLIHSGYKPKNWKNFILNKNESINITIEHKIIN